MLKSTATYHVAQKKWNKSLIRTGLNVMSRPKRPRAAAEMAHDRPGQSITSNTKMAGCEWKEYLYSEGYEKLSEAKRYSDELSLDDSDDDPYRSFYIARDNLSAVRKILKKNFDKWKDDEDFIFVWAALEIRIGLQGIINPINL